MSMQKYVGVALLSVVVIAGVSVVRTKDEPKTDVKVSAPLAAKSSEPKFDVAHTDLKIRYVDVFGAMRESREGGEAAAKVEERRLELAKNIEAKVKKLEVAATDFKTKSSTMNETARTKKEREVVDMKRDYDLLLQDSEEEMKVVMQQVTEALAKEVEKAVTELAKKDGLDAVVDKVTGRTIWSSEKGDLTLQVVQSMNKNYAYKLAHNEKSAASFAKKVA